MEKIVYGELLPGGNVWIDLPDSLTLRAGDTISVIVRDGRPTLGEALSRVFVDPVEGQRSGEHSLSLEEAVSHAVESPNVIRKRRNELEEARIGMDDTQYKLCKPTSTDVLLQLHDEMCRRARAIMRKKNSDYGARDENDPFRNFHSFGALGILVRLSDKMARIRTFLEKAARGEQLAVSDESWDDTVLDAINYLILFAGYVRVHGAKK